MGMKKGKSSENKGIHITLALRKEVSFILIGLLSRIHIKTVEFRGLHILMHKKSTAFMLTFLRFAFLLFQT